MYSAAALMAKGAMRRTHNDLPVETDSDDMLFMQTDSGTYQVKAATLDSFLERLTHDYIPNHDDIRAFVLHYDKFLTAEDLMTRLLQRFRTVSACASLNILILFVL